ncbi:hypothetical protein MNBD_GAMMA23-1059 [hydrothermal vent metagenome]|uniref:DUF2845 domain-containing protein n=1 Tax=hydrothermal vent metagenome TaxID=652676 RepID=A0A3B0ZTI4_9ZZZZ
MKLLSVLFYFIAIISSPSAFADSLNCKNNFAEIGDSKASVLFKCGTPMFKDSFFKSVKAKTSSSQAKNTPTLQCETIDQWTYNPGPGQFLTTLQFERGLLVSIKYGDRIPPD